MANRVMAQKRMKMKRQRRAWARAYSMSSGITPNRGVLQEYKERACGLGISEFGVDELIRTFYGREPVQGVSAGKHEVELLLKKLKKSVPQMLFFMIHDDNYQKSICWFNASKTCYVISHTDKKKNVTKTSLEYGSKERALSQYDCGKTVWVSIQSGLPLS